MEKMTGAQALVKSIQRNGVDTIFGIPGAQLNVLMDAIYLEGETLRYIHTRHEQGAAYMAFGYAQSTGNVGVCSVVPGPGLLNAAAAVCTAYGCGAPVLCVAGQIPSHFIGKGYGILHEIDDQMSCLRPVTKWQARIEHPNQAPERVRQAFEQLTSGRRQPVMVDMAPDVMAKEVSLDLSNCVGVGTDPDPDEDLIEQAARLLGSAVCPGIFVGGGIFGAEEELLELAEALQAPVIMSPHGFGAVDWRHYLAQNMIAGAELWPGIDVSLAVGTRFQMPMINWGKDDGIKMIRIDPDPKQSIQAWQPDVHIVTTAKKALTLLCDRISRHNRKRPSRQDELNEVKQRATDHIQRHMGPQHAFASAIRQRLPDDGVICMDVTQLHFHARVGFPVYKPRTLIQPGHQGTLGYGYPTALGAKIANPHKAVICVAGDGGFMFNVQEMATAVQHKINVVLILFNDNAFGNVKRAQKELYEERYIGCELKNPDFMKLAESFGMLGLCADTPDELGPAIEKALNAQAPALIEVRCGNFPGWYKAMPYRKLR